MDESNKTPDNKQAATDEEATKLTEVLTGFLRESERILAEAVPLGPTATLFALTSIINELVGCRNEIASIMISNCGNPDCLVHGTQAGPTDVELHDATDAGANMSEQPAPPDADHYYDLDLDDDID